MTNAIKLDKIKPNQTYQFTIYYNSGAGSGSSGTYKVNGRVKEINAEFIRLFKNNGTKQSFKIENRSIIGVQELNL
jgi:hypothetical protein